jgi:hypothetical protein
MRINSIKYFRIKFIWRAFFFCGLQILVSNIYAQQPDTAVQQTDSLVQNTDTTSQRIDMVFQHPDTIIIVEVGDVMLVRYQLS